MANGGAQRSALSTLGQAIVSGHPAIGASLPPEAELGEALGVSRTVVREVVKTLVAKGLISTGPKVGTRVLAAEHWNWFDPEVMAWQARTGLSKPLLRDLQELRRALEPAAARLAAGRATAADLAELQAAYEGMHHAVHHGGDYVSHDLHFHQTLLRASHNRLIVQMSKAIGALLRTSFELWSAKPDGTLLSLPLHREVVDAVVAGDTLRAEVASFALIDHASDDIESMLGSRRRRVPSMAMPAVALKGR